MKRDKEKAASTPVQDARFARYLTVEEVAQILRRSPRTVRDWIIDGCPTPHGRVRLDAAKLGKSWTVRADWLALFEFRVRPPVGRTALDLDESERRSGPEEIRA